MTPEARKKRNEYMREWRSRNREKVRQYNQSYWERVIVKEKSWRCEHCNKLLLKYHFMTGDPEVKCQRCGKMNKFNAETLEVL